MICNHGNGDGSNGSGALQQGSGNTVVSAGDLLIAW